MDKKFRDKAWCLSTAKTNVLDVQCKWCLGSPAKNGNRSAKKISHCLLFVRLRKMRKFSVLRNKICENLAWKIRKFCKFGEKMEIFIKQLLQEKKRNYWLYNIITSQSKEFQKYFLYLQHIMVFAELFFRKISRNYFSRNFSSFLHFFA